MAHMATAFGMLRMLLICDTRIIRMLLQQLEDTSPEIEHFRQVKDHVVNSYNL